MDRIQRIRNGNSVLHHQCPWRTALFRSARRGAPRLGAGDERDGVLIITAAADQGLVDILDREPLILSPEGAKEWMAPATLAERAAPIVKAGCRPVEDLRWFPVGKAVGNVRNQDAELPRRLDGD